MVLEANEKFIQELKATLDEMPFIIEDKQVLVSCDERLVPYSGSSKSLFLNQILMGKMQMISSTQATVSTDGIIKLVQALIERDILQYTKDPPTIADPDYATKILFIIDELLHIIKDKQN